jgi:CRP/FNR family transcriptional regulator, cyclic AMP receptor protein
MLCFMADCWPTMLTYLQSNDLPKTIGHTGNSYGLFRSFPPQIQKLLSTPERIKKFADKQLIHHRGDPSDGFWIIKSGQVKLGRYDDEGDLQLLLILGEGESFGELSCLGQFARVVDVEALGETELQWVSEARLSEALAASIEFSRLMIKGLSAQLQEALDNLIVLRKEPPNKRLIRSLIRLCQGRAEPVKLVIRQQELSELVGVSRMSISKALSQLQAKGILECRYGNILIADIAALKNALRN